MKFKFNNDEDGIRSMAVLTAQFVKEGVVFVVESWPSEWIITLTGGF